MYTILSSTIYDNTSIEVFSTLKYSLHLNQSYRHIYSVTSLQFVLYFSIHISMYGSHVYSFFMVTILSLSIHISSLLNWVYAS